jgi:GTP:adenosylcobinamide-phosphate guanylyltransferase
MEIINKGTARWSAPADSPANSAYQTLQQLPENQPALITTADHPLLRPEIIDDFLERAGASGADLAAGVTTINAIHEKFPGARKTVMRFSDDGYCGCNLFAFLTPRSHRVANAWRTVEKQRKNPLYIIRQLGLGSVLRYLLGILRMETAAERLSQKLGVTIKPVLLPFPEAAIDVDTVDDQRFVETILGTDK